MFYIQWHITNRCNLRCAHCYQEDYFDELSFDDLKKIFLDIENYILTKTNQKISIALTGGEPFLHSGFESFLEYLAMRDSIEELMVLTNGTLVTEEYAHYLKKNRVERVQISIDGGTTEKHDYIRGAGSLKKTLEGVKNLRKAGIEVQAQMVVHRDNVDSVSDLIKLCDEHGIDRLLITRLVPIGNASETLTNSLLTKEEYKNLLFKLEDYSKREDTKVLILKARQLWRLINPKLGSSCPVGQSSITILADGSLSPCRRLPLSIGNLLEDSFFKLWYSSKILWDLRDRNNLKGKCGRCPDKEKCGGCRAIAYGFTNDYLTEDPYCWRDC